MKITNFITRLKLSVELKKNSKNIDDKTRNIVYYFRQKYNSRNVIGTFQNEQGGGLGVLFVGLAVIFLAFIVFVNIADYSLFTYKRNVISKAMDYAVNAAVQEIDNNQSLEGVANGFTEASGKKLLEGVEIDIDRANRTFLSVFYENYKLNNLSINDKLLICATSTLGKKLRYSIKAEAKQSFVGELENSELIEQRINEAIIQYWPSSEDNSQVHIAGNSKTNMVEKGTYLFVFMKDIKLTGLYSQRKIDLSSFAGAKLERLIKASP